MLRRNVEVTYDQFRRAAAKVADLDQHHRVLALRIFCETPSEEILEKNITIDEIYKTIKAMQYAIDAGAAKFLDYHKSYGDEATAVLNYRVDKALGLV